VRWPSKEERKLFRDAVADVKPLVKRDRIVTTRGSVRATRKAATQTSAVPDDVLGSRRATPRIDATLDLHGLIAEAARRRLLDFIAAAHTAHLERVRIVHGKGLRSGPGGPVLKVLVERTLDSLDEVADFESASAADGGSGATIARLRTARSRTAKDRR
jgi:DNA-nicking Smr family endonuclease